MSWIKDNKFIVALGGGTLAGAILLFVFGSQGSGRYAQAQEKFQVAADEAAGFEKLALYPQAANRDAKRKALETNLNARLAEAEAKIAAGKAQAMNNVSAIATEAAGAIVRQITGRDADPQALAKAVAGQNV